MKNACVMGVDMGGTTVKAAVYDCSGAQLSVAAAETELLIPVAGWAERDMEMFYRQVCMIMRQALEESGAAPADIAAISFSGHGKGLYLWGEGGPVRAGILSTDNRAAPIVDRWQRDGTAGRVRAITRQSVLVSQPCALLRWLREQEPESYRRIRWVFEAKDYIRFRLTGEAFSERTDASGTGLMNLGTASFDPALFEAYGIPEMFERMPPLRGSFDRCGVVTGEAARLTGLAEGTPVAAGMFDIDACALALGILDERFLCAIAGTWSINEYITQRVAENTRVLMHSLYCLPGYTLVEESSPTSAGNLEWFAAHLLDRERAEMGKAFFRQLDAKVEALGPQGCRSCFLPYVFGGSENPFARGCFVGLDASDGKISMARAVFEGVVFCHNAHIEKLLSSRTEPPLGLRLGGGAARSRVWSQMFADVTGLPVDVSGARETGTLGAAIAAAVACGMYPDVQDAVHAMIPPFTRLEPDASAHAVYQGKYERYRRIIEALEPCWKQGEVNDDG